MPTSSPRWRAADLDREVKLRWRTDQALAIATSQRLAHTVGANEVFARLVGAARSGPGAELVTWWGERYSQAVLGEVVRPDGVGVWREGEATVTFCLEYDRGTESARPPGRQGGRLRPAGACLGRRLLASGRGARSAPRAGVRAALSGHGLAVATTTAPAPAGPTPPSGRPSTPKALACGWPSWPAGRARRLRPARLAHSARCRATGRPGHEAR